MTPPTDLPVELQLQRLRIVATLLGLDAAADWLGKNANCCFVYVDQGGAVNRHPLWYARELEKAKKSANFIVTCALCSAPAEAIDTLYPYHQEHNRCAAHMGQYP
ncbi:MAG: hypothetical protein ACRCWJ_19035 [Casimicrobium sp.]